MTLAVAICCATTMAQTNIIAIGKYVDRFPKLPPLSADLGGRTKAIRSRLLHHGVYRKPKEINSINNLTNNKQK